MIEPITAEQIKAEGYHTPIQSEAGNWYALAPFLFTWAIIGEIDATGYARRWCYHTYLDALYAYKDWIDAGFKDDPKGWHRAIV